MNLPDTTSRAELPLGYDEDAGAVAAATAAAAAAERREQQRRSADDTAEDAPRARVRRCVAVRLAFASETRSIGARHARHVSGSRQPACAPNCLTTAGVAVVVVAVVADCDVNRDDYDAARTTRASLKIENGRILEDVISS